MILIDSNLIIHAARPENSGLRRFIAENEPAVSVVSIVEVLGFHAITAEEKTRSQNLFAIIPSLAISNTVIDSAVEVRQTRRMTLGDALIGATALVFKCALATRNVRDFNWIPSLRVLDPMASIPPTTT